MRKLINQTILCIVLHLALFASVFATDVVLSPFQIRDLHVIGTTIKVRLYSSDNWTDSDGHQRLPGQAGSSTGAFQEIICSVSGTTATCPSSGTLIIPSTIDSIDRPNVRISASIFDEKNSFKGNLFQNWRIPASPTTTTWRDLVVYNASQQRPLNDTFATTQQVQNLISAITPAPKSTTVISGIGRVYPAPVDVADPEFTGTNHPAILSSTRWTNVKAHGVTGSGSDESANIQIAANAAAADSGVLYFSGLLNEVYTFANVSIPANVLVIQDRHTLLKMKAQTTAAYPLFNVTGSNVTFLNLKIDGNKSAQTVFPSGYAECECYSNPSLGGAGSAFRSGIKADAIVTPGITDVRVEGCTFTNMFGSSIVMVGVDRPTANDNTVLDSYRAAVELGGGNAAGTAWSKDAVVTNNRAINITRYNAFLLTGYDGGTFTGNTLRNVDRSMKIEGGRNITVSDNRFLDVVTLDCAALCGSLEGNAIQITSGTTSCGYFMPDPSSPTADGATPQCGARNITIDHNIIDHSGGGGIGLQTGAGGIDGVKITNNIMTRINGPGAGVGVRITQDAIGYIPSNILIEDNLMTDIRQNAVFMYAGNNVHIRNNTFLGLQWASISNAIAVQPEPGLTAINGLEITDNYFAFWSPTGGAVVLYTSTTAPPNNTKYDYLQVKGNTFNSGSASSNYAFRADLTTLGAGAQDYILSGSVFSGNTFVGAVRAPHLGLHWMQDNKVTATANNNFTPDQLPGSQIYTGSATVTPGVVAANNEYTTTITVVGATVGDPCYVGASTNTSGVRWTCQVTSTGVVTVFGSNIKVSASSSIGSTTLKVRVHQAIS